jgi:hypothetical protein
MTRLVIALLLIALASAGCTRTPERRAEAGEWIGPPADADGKPILPPSYLAPHIQGCQP